MSDRVEYSNVEGLHLPFGRRHRFGDPASRRSRLAELMVLCARIGFNP